MDERHVHQCPDTHSDTPTTTPDTCRGRDTGSESDRADARLSVRPSVEGREGRGRGPKRGSMRPCEPASPAPPPAQGGGGAQHAPVLKESTVTLTESVGALIASSPPHWQHEDRGHQAAASLPPVPGACFALGVSPHISGCSWTGSSHAPVGHLATLFYLLSSDSIHLLNLYL